MEIEDGGLKYKFEGKYHIPRQGDYYLSSTGEVCRATHDHYTKERAIVTRVRPRHEFDGLIFEETDSARYIMVGEWFLLNGSPCGWKGPNQTYGRHIPLTLIT